MSTPTKIIDLMAALKASLSGRGHAVVVHEDGPGFRAVCACGWNGYGMRFHDDAEAEGLLHAQAAPLGSGSSGSAE